MTIDGRGTFYEEDINNNGPRVLRLKPPRRSFRLGHSLRSCARPSRLLLELTEGGKRPITLSNSESRTFLLGTARLSG